MTEEQEIAAGIAPLADVEAQMGPAQFAPGAVVLRVENAFLNRSQTSNRSQLNAECTILEHSTEPSAVGKAYTKRWGLDLRENLEWLKGDLEKLGITETDYLKICKELTGVVFKGSLVKNKDEAYGPNLFINRGARLEGYEGPSGAVAGGGEGRI